MFIVGYALFMMGLIALAEFAIKRSRNKWLWTAVWSLIIGLGIISPIFINMYLAPLKPKIPELACGAVALGALMFWLNWAKWLKEKHAALIAARKQRAAEVIATIEPTLQAKAQGGYRIATNFARIDITELPAQRMLFENDPEGEQLFDRYLKARTTYERD